MKSYRMISLIIVFLALALGIAYLPISPARAATPPGFKLGVFMEDTSQLPAFESSIGRQTDIFLYYQSLAEDFDVAAFTPMGQQGKAIQLALEFWDPGAPDLVNQPSYQLRDITNGNWDADIHRWAREMRDYGYPVRIRPLCEMNGNWTSWSGTVNGNQPGDYVPAWRHIHDIFAAEGATNVKFVWSPNRDGDTVSAAGTFNTYYPGDAYVDYVGIDGYNWGTMYNTPDWVSEWQDIDTIFGPSYDAFTARTSKPLMISETASTELGGDKAAWITNTFASLPVRFPRIDSLTWFNIDKETDWRVNSSPASLTAFKAAVAQADTTPPSVALSAPANGASVSGDVTMTASASDNVGVSKVEFYVDGALNASDTAAPWSAALATRALADGAHTLTAKAYDAAGNSSVSSISVTVNNSQDRNYYFGAYDSATPGMTSWVVISNSSATPQHAEVYIGGKLEGSYDVGPSQRATPLYAGVSGGPVKVVSTTGGGLMVSERSLYNGTFSELPAAPDGQLSTEQVLTWYDEKSAGLRTTLVIANEGSQTSQVDVRVAGNLVGHYDVPAGGRVMPDYPGLMDGPVRVSSSNGQPLSLSARVFYNGSFNEAAAVPASSLASEYYFTWYDCSTPGMWTWVLVGNQGSQATNVDIYIAGRLMGRYNVPAGGRVTPVYPGTMNGPVHVISADGQPLIVSQRSLYMNSFEETAATRPDAMVSQQYFAWYDSASAGMLTWVLVGNQGQSTASVDVKVAGNLVGHYDIPAGGRVTPLYPGLMNGPVEVSGSPGSQLVVSQRVLYGQSFDEVGGRAPQ